MGSSDLTPAMLSPTIKTAKGLVPNDPVVGTGTISALDDDLFFDPPTLDPVFAEFSPSVVDRRLEPFIALELSALLHTPLDSWRHMLGFFALNSLNSGQILGIVAQTRSLDLRDRFLAVADPIQNGLNADAFFDDEIILNGDLAKTIPFSVGGQFRSFIIIGDQVILGRASIRRDPIGTRAAVTLQGVVVHELNHALNVSNSQQLRATADNDAAVYADTALAQARSASTGPTSETLRLFVGEAVARHIHWIVLKELSGTPGSTAAGALAANLLAMAARFYFAEVTSIWDPNGYGAGINSQGESTRLHQLDLWLQLCAAPSFSTIAADNQKSVLAFQAAAQFCNSQVAAPNINPAQQDGLFPLAQDFV